MSLYGVMRTSTSGMIAQASRISTVAENVANANTTGYKTVRSEFSSVFIDSNVSTYNSGSVDVQSRRLVDRQGTLTATNSITDLAIQGDGFLMVRDTGGEVLMTRAGSFVPNANNELVNTAGFTLMGYPVDANGATGTVNGFAGLVPVQISNVELAAAASTEGSFAANLPSSATVVPAASLPSTNSPTATYTAKSSLVAYDNLGGESVVDVYFSKTSTGTWEVAVYDQSSASTTGGFPYSSGPIGGTTLTFDMTNGKLDGASATSVSIAVPDGQALNLDLSQMSQLATDYTVLDANVDGNAASAAEIVEISRDGYVYVTFDNGTRQALFRIPLGNVTSPDNMEAVSGNAFTPTSRSGDLRIGFPGDAGYGELLSGVLEQSTTDIASEFTDMIDAQRSYTANSKVFQTGAELMDVLVNLKR